MRNNGQQPQRGGQQGRARHGQQGMRGHQGSGRQPQYGQQYGRRPPGYEHPENRYREPPQSTGWRSQSSASWEDEDLRGYAEEFGGLEGNEQPRWDRWNEDESFTEQQYGEQRDRFGNEGARGYYGGSSGGMGAGRGFVGSGEFNEQAREGTSGYSGREGFGSQSYGGMGWRGERSSSMGPGGVGSHMGTHLGGMGPQRYARGPKGYKRSDERIKEDVSDRIFQLHDVDASDVELEVKSGEVTLTGSVPTRNMKWQLETLVDSVAGVTDVNNQLRIKRESPSTSGTEKSPGGPTRK